MVTLGLLLGHLGLLGLGSSELDLFGLLLVSLFLLGILCLLNQLVSLFLSQGRALGLLLLDQIDGGTNDGTLDLDTTGDLLLGSSFSDTLLVETTEDNGPVQLGGLETLHEVGLTLGVDETEDLFG